MRTIKDKVIWIDILKPNQEDVEFLKKQHPFHPIILDEILQPSARAKVEKYDNYLFVVFHIPVYDQENQTSRRAEVDFLITKNKIISIRYENLEQFDAIFNALSRDEKMRKEILGQDSLLLIYHMIESIISFSSRQVRHIEEQVTHIAKEIFNKKEEELLKKISYVKRDILDYRLIVKPQEPLLHSWVETGVKFWGEKSRVYLKDLVGDHLKILQTLENYFESIESLEETNAQLLEAQTNAAMKRLTSIGFLISIPLFFVFLMGISYVENLVSTTTHFWTLFALVIVLTLWVALILRKKKML